MASNADRLRKAVDLLMVKYQVNSLESLCEKIHVGRSYLSEMMNQSKPITDRFLSKLKFNEGVNDLYIKEGKYPIIFSEFLPNNGSELSLALRKVALATESGQNNEPTDHGGQDAVQVLLGRISELEKDVAKKDALLAKQSELEHRVHEIKINLENTMMDLQAISRIQKAQLELLLFLTQQSDGHKPSAAILKKYELEGIFF